MRISGNKKNRRKIIMSEKEHCRKCGREMEDWMSGSGMCDDCFNDAVEKQRDSLPGGPDYDPR
jgi:hypothetical protein